MYQPIFRRRPARCSTRLWSTPTTRSRRRQELERAPLTEVASTKLRRLTVNIAKRGKRLQIAGKWWTEKHLEHRFESCTVTRAQAMGDGEACLVSRQRPDAQFGRLSAQCAAQRDRHPARIFRAARPADAVRRGHAPALSEAHDANVLNVSIRAVDAQRITMHLSYAPEPAFSIVLYLNQKTDPAGNRHMRALTSDLIDLSPAPTAAGSSCPTSFIKHGGVAGDGPTRKPRLFAEKRHRNPGSRSATIGTNATLPFPTSVGGGSNRRRARSCRPTAGPPGASGADGDLRREPDATPAGAVVERHGDEHFRPRQRRAADGTRVLRRYRRCRRSWSVRDTVRSFVMISVNCA